MHEDDIHETPSSTPNFRTELAAQLAELVPEAIADGKVDVAKLQELLDGDAADGNERFGLFWPGKKRALRVAQEPTTATLKPDFENSTDWDTTKNVFIEGDNLEVLKILQRHYHGKIKMIYIDPPYNTGKDFVYKDSFGDGVQHYLNWTQQVGEDGKKLSSNSEAEGRYHSNWLNMMYPRLKLARNLLTNDGILVVHIDEHESHHLRKLLEEVFGEAQFLGEIVWNKKNPKGDSLGISYQHESLLVFARSSASIGESGGLWREKENGARILEKARALIASNGAVDDSVRSQFREWLSKQDVSGGEKAYSLIDAEGRVFQRVSMAWPNTKPAPADYHVPLVHPVTKLPCPVPESGWRNPSATMQALVDAGEVDFGVDHTTQPRRKYYLQDNLSERVPSLLSDGTTDKKWLKDHKIFFDNPKPLSVAKKLVGTFTEQEDIVLDFFAGSGTTAHAVFAENAAGLGARRFILVQLPETPAQGTEASNAGWNTIPQMSRKRLRDAAAEIKAQMKASDGSALDLGFRSFRLVDSNFSKWRVSSEIEAGDLEQQLLGLRDSSDDDATPDDLLTEILLKQGFSLTEQIKPIEISGLEMRAVLQEDADLAVLAYLNEHKKPSLDQLRAMVDEIPGGKVIVLEDAFQGDDELKTNLAQLCKSNGIELWTA